MITPATHDRAAQRADAREWAGYRSAHIAQATGRLVVVVNAAEHGLDDDDGETAWYTICADHGQLVGHRTLALARSHAADPVGWCEVCAGTDDTWEDDFYADAATCTGCDRPHVDGRCCRCLGPEHHEPLNSRPARADEKA